MRIYRFAANLTALECAPRVTHALEQPVPPLSRCITPLRSDSQGELCGGSIAVAGVLELQRSAVPLADGRYSLRPPQLQDQD